MTDAKKQRRSTPSNKLTPAKEAAVAAAYNAGGSPVREIAEFYGVSRQTVYNIVRRLTPQGAGA